MWLIDRLPGGLTGLSRTRPVPFTDPAAPTVGRAAVEVAARVDALTTAGVDEGTGAALDPLTWSWAAGWLAQLDVEHADHSAVVARLIGRADAAVVLAEAHAAFADERAALAHADLLAARAAVAPRCDNPTDGSSR